MYLSYRGHKYTLDSKGSYREKGVGYKNTVVEGQAHYSVSDQILEAFVDGRSHILGQSYDDILCMSDK